MTGVQTCALPISEIFSISKEKLEERIEKIRKKLFIAREKRIRPHKDDKILTDWNGLMIAALAKGAQVFENEKYLKAALDAADFILNNMCKDNQLLHRFRENEAAIKGNLDDYAFLIYGLLELYESSFIPKYLKTALSLTNTLLEHFWDKRDGGFYFTPDFGEEILVRKKEIYDSAIPSGNSIQMLNLLRLSKITENEELKKTTIQSEKAFSEQISKTPYGYTQFMVALDFKFGPSYEVVIAGNKEAKDTKIILNSIRGHFIPNKTLVIRSPGEDHEMIKIIPSLEFKEMENNEATVYICSEGTCKSPTNDLNDISEILNMS